MPTKVRSTHTTTPTVDPSDDLLTALEAAALIGVSYQSLANWRHHRRHIPYLKRRGGSGVSIFYRRADLEEYMRRSAALVEHPVEIEEGDRNA